MSPLSGHSTKLLDELRRATRLRHYSRRTEEAYVRWVRRFVRFHRTRHPRELGPAEVSQFLSSLATEHGVSASTQNQALAALLFLYGEVLGMSVGWVPDIVRAKEAFRLPVVLTRAEVRAILGRMVGIERLVAALLYGSGLRLLEGLQLRVKDFDFAAREIRVRAGKGNRDRVTMLPDRLVGPVRRHLEVVQRQHERDVAEGAGWVQLPGALDRKYVSAGQEWPWQWVFPASRRYVDPSTCQERRHHLHETVVQRAFRAALRASGVAKKASCHTLRHSFATHLWPATTSARFRSSWDTGTSGPR